MAKINEPFLINSPRRLPKRRTSRNPWTGETARHRAAATAGFAGPAYKSAKGAKHWAKARPAKKAKVLALRKRKARSNPLGESLMIVGLNPKHKKKGGVTTMAIKRRKRARKLSANPRKRVVRRRKRSLVAKSNPVKRRVVHRRKRSVVAKRSPIRRRRSYRSNPEIASGGINWAKPMTYLPFIATGAVAAITTAVAPRMLGLTNPMFKLGTQAAVAIGGSMAANAIAGRNHGFVFGITSGAVILADVLNEYVVKPMGFSGMLGLGEGDYEDNMSAYENAMSGLDAEELMEMSGDEDELSGEFGAYTGTVLWKNLKTGQTFPQKRSKLPVGYRWRDLQVVGFSGLEDEGEEDGMEAFEDQAGLEGEGSDYFKTQ